MKPFFLAALAALMLAGCCTCSVPKKKSQTQEYPSDNQLRDS